MVYQADDLDLRTPPGWSASGAGPQHAEQANWLTRSTVYHGGRRDPIWVDDTVMACTNHAYDLAMAHRAPEVRLDHVLNALTLSDAATRVLQARGINVAGLRVDTNELIASDKPNGKGKIHPKHSQAMEEMLRLAADRAYQQRSPINVDDLLYAMFEMDPELPGLELLHRHVSPLADRNGHSRGALLRLEPLPHLSAATTGGDRNANNGHYASRSSKRQIRTVTDRESQPSREALQRPEVTDPSITVVDDAQNNRIAALERAIRDFGLDLADDRKSLRTLVKDLQRNAASQADDTRRLEGGLSERITALEDTLERSRHDGDVPHAVIDRLSLMERNLDSRLAEIGDASSLPRSITDRLDQIDRSLQVRMVETGRSAPAIDAMVDRLNAIERNLEARFADLDQAEGPTAVLMERFEEIERRLDARLVTLGRSTGSVPTALVDRFERVEQILEARLNDVISTSAHLSDRVEALERMFAEQSHAERSADLAQQIEVAAGVADKLDALERTYQLILDRLIGLERHVASDHKTGDSALVALGQRMTALSDTVKANGDLTSLSPALSKIETSISGLERSVENRSAESGRTISFIGERLRAFESAIDNHPAAAQLAGVEQTVNAARESAHQRLDRIEHALALEAERAAEAATAHQHDLSELHEALIRLNSNQQTLGASLQQWRLDNTGDLSVVSNRLKALEENDQRQLPVLHALASQISGVHAALMRNKSSNGHLQRWLFGTDEWYAASYDTSNWQTRRRNEAARDAQPPL